MINIAGNYIFGLNIEGFGELPLLEHDLIYFSITEYSGCCLPTFNLEFKTTIDNIRNYLNENNLIKVTLGPDMENLKTYPIRLWNKTEAIYGNSFWSIRLSGILDVIPFIKKRGFSSFEGTASQLVSDLTNKYGLRLETDIEENQSNQVWLRCKQTSRDFMVDGWLHSHIPDSFPLMAITSDGVVRFLDGLKNIKKNPKYVFGHDKTDSSNFVLIQGKPCIRQKTSDINYKTQNIEYTILDILNNTRKKVDIVKKEPMLALTETVDQSTEELTKGMLFYQTDSVHETYWESFCNNVSNLTFLSGVQVSVLTADPTAIDVKPLDVVQLHARKQIKVRQTEGYYSGKYIVSEVLTEFKRSEKTVFKKITMERESFNELKDIGLIKDKAKAKRDSLREDRDPREALLAHKVSKALSITTRFLANFFMGGCYIPPIRTLLMTGLTYMGNFGYNILSLWFSSSFLYTTFTKGLVSTLLNILYRWKATFQSWKYIFANNAFYLLLKNASELAKYRNTENNTITIPNMNYFDLDKITDDQNIEDVVFPDLGFVTDDVVVPLTPEDLTPVIFDLTVQGCLEDGVLSTGNSFFDDVLKGLSQHVMSDCISSSETVEVYQAFWGVCKETNITQELIKKFYREKSIRKEFNKPITSQGNSVFVLLPKDLGEGQVFVDATHYTTEPREISLKVGDDFIPYYIYSLGVHEGNIRVEVRFDVS